MWRKRTHFQNVPTKNNTKISSKNFFKNLDENKLDEDAEISSDEKGWKNKL